MFHFESNAMLLFGFVWTFREREKERICYIFYTIRVDRLFIPLSREDRKKGKTIESSSLD